jgi:hypothetical protein
MNDLGAETPMPDNPRERASEYLFDMIGELARLAQNIGEPDIAILLDAITAARRATAKDRSA